MCHINMLHLCDYEQIQMEFGITDVHCLVSGPV